MCNNQNITSIINSLIDFENNCWLQLWLLKCVVLQYTLLPSFGKVFLELSVAAFQHFSNYSWHSVIALYIHWMYAQLPINEEKHLRALPTLDINILQGPSQSDYLA